MVDPRTPILVGCGQLVQKEKDIHIAKSPLALMAQASELAAQDTGLGAKLWDEVDTITSVRFITDSPDSARLPFGRYGNVAKSLATKLGANPANTCYGPTGGNTPQYLVNYTAEKIAQGDQEVVLIAGAECFGTMMRALGQGEILDWGGDPEGTRIDIGNERIGVTDVESAHKLQYPVNCYPLFENALRGEAGRTIAEQQLYVGKLMSPFSKVAAQHPQAWFPIERSPEEIATETAQNRYVGYPYTKYMNAIMQVDQGAALVMMSVGKAQELGVPEDKWVYLHGCGDANDIWYLSERVNYHSSPAIRTMGRKAFDMAGWTVDEIEEIDLYSCFPSAVQIGRKELGIAEDDPRALTVTGGLPYFGGAGNNYVTHSIATLMDRLRAKPGSKGMCTSNGWYVTKHGIGLYSTTPKEGKWERENPANYQVEIDNEAHPEVEEKPQGAAKIETYAVMHGRNGPEFGLVMGRLDENNKRFVAHATNQADILSLKDIDSLGRAGTVGAGEKGKNILSLG
jgi:acetyl-CoA C-acetyltransferase